MHSFRWPFLLLALVTGCAANVAPPTQEAPDAAPDAATSDDAGLGWGDNTAVEAVFEANCAVCHGSQWSSCWSVQANADEVEGAVSSGAMPRGGSLSSEDKKTLFNWLSDGAPCSGQNPYATDAGADAPPSPPISVVAG